MTQEMTMGGPLYIEGYVPFVKVMQGSKEIFTARMEFDKTLSRELNPGTYGLQFLVRPCDGNCGYLDPPAETCSVTLSISSGFSTRVHAVEKPTEGCTLRVSN